MKKQQISIDLYNASRSPNRQIRMSARFVGQADFRLTSFLVSTMPRSSSSPDVRDIFLDGCGIRVLVLPVEVVMLLEEVDSQSRH
jgi:hypothetical protein